MDAVSAVVTQPASSATVLATTTATTTIPTSSNAINVNQSNNHIHSHTNTHNSGTSTAATTNSRNQNISGGGGVISNSSNSNSSCSSSSTSSNSSGYGSTTTTPTNNYDLQQQTTPTTTPVPTTPVAITEPTIPVATVAAVTPFYNESITTHNLETHQLQHHPLHPQQQHQQQLQQHHLLQPNHHQLPQSHLQSNLQQQQYLQRQQYYSTYDYQQPAPTHNLTGGSSAAPTAYNLGIAGTYDISASSYGSGQYKSSGLTGAINYERTAGVRTNATANYNSQQQQPSEQQQTKTINQQTQPFSGVLTSSKQRSSSLIGNTTSTNTSKPQAAATPFYAQPLVPQTHSNPTPFYENSKYKMPLEYHDSYSNPSAAAATASYHQQQKYYAAAKSQLKEAGYGTPVGLTNSKSVYPNTGNFFPGPAASYDKYMYPHASATGYSTTTGHLCNETPPDVGNYRKPVVASSMNSPSWPWGIDYASGNSRTIPPPPPASHLPTATVAPTHATYLTPNPTALSRDPYYMGHDKYSVKYDKYAAASYQQSYVSPPASRHHIWPNAPHGSNLQQLNERHLLASGTAPPPSHGLHSTPYFPANANNGLNSRQSCCSQPYQPQSCYYPPSHPMAPRLPHNQTAAVAAPSSGYLSSQQPLGQSAHLNALSASCKYGSIIPDYGSGNKLKNSNDLYLNAHHYDNNSSPHNYGYGSAHSSQQLYASNAHQSMAHGLTPSSILTHDPLNANPASYTNDLSLTTSNFDNYHTHLDTHLSPPTLAGIHGQQPPPAYGPTVAKRALLDYRKPIQPQPPPTIAEECYTTLTSRDHYNQQELLNTPETTTTFGEYETHQDNAASLSSYSHTTEVLGEADKTNDEGNKNLSLRDFIANWNDDEDEYQNNEELNFEQSNVIDEVLQTAPVEQEAASTIVEKTEVIKTTTLDSKNKADLKEFHKSVENLENSTLNESYINLPDIVIDIEKSNNVNNSITTPSTTPTPPTQQEENNSSSLNLNNFDVEKELDELKFKKSPQQQEITKDLNDIKDTINTVSTPQLSPCKNLTTQLSFEDLNLEPANKTVLSSDQSSELTENYFKDMEGYESGSSRHSNESAFEKEYETFINKITSNTSTTKNTEEKSADMDFEQNVHDFSKFYKRKRKLKEDELKATEPETQNPKKLKPNIATKVNNSNFPQVYTKKSRNRLQKTKPQIAHKRKPLSLYYKIIHSIRRFGLYRLRRVREYMTELKEKHLPLIKRQSIKNYTHDIKDNLCNPKSLKALCIMAVNTEEFHKILMLSLADEGEESSSETEEKHICTDPTCETCEVIKSLMEAESFKETLIQPVAENPIESSSILCEEAKSESIEILEDATYQKVKPIMISNATENIQYSKENPTKFDAKDFKQHALNPADINTLLYENSCFETQSVILNSQYQSNINKAETMFDLENWYEKSISPDQDLQDKGVSEIPVYESAKTVPDQDKENVETSLNPVAENEISEIPQTIESDTLTKSIEETEITEEDKLNLGRVEGNVRSKTYIDNDKQKEAGDSHLISQIALCNDENSNVSNTSTNKKKLEYSTTAAEFNEISKTNHKRQDSDESETSESDSDSSSSSSDDESVDESKESYKKSENNASDSDTDSESDLENDDAKINSDTNESNQSKHTDLEKCKLNTEVLKPIKLKTIGLSRNSIQESESFNPTSMESITKTDSDEEDEFTPKRHQRIVLRIKKSFQPSPNNNDSREIYVSEKSIESSDEFDSQTESESEDDNDDDVVSNSKLSPRPKEFLENPVSEKSIPLNTDLDNPTESEDENSKNDSKTDSKPLNFSSKQEELIVTEKSMESQKALDNQTESESEDSNGSEKETETPFPSPKKIDCEDDIDFEKTLEPHYESDYQCESNDDELPEKKSKLMTPPLELTPHHSNHTNSNSENLEDAKESASEEENIVDRKSVIVSMPLNLQEDLEESGKLHTEFDNQLENKIEKDDNHILEQERALYGDVIKDYNSPKSSELYKESESHNLDNESNIITKTIDMTSTPQNVMDEEKSADLISDVELFTECSPRLESSKEIVAVEKSSKITTEFDKFSENSLKDDDVFRKKSNFVETPIEIKQKLEYFEKNIPSKQETTQGIEADDHTESQSEDETDEEQELQLKTPNKKLLLKEDDEKISHSDSESSSDSEFESDEEDNPKEPKPIVISEDDSMDSSDIKEDYHQPKKCTSQISEDFNEQFGSDSRESLINDHNKEICINSQDFLNEASNLSSNIANFPNMTNQDANDEEIPATQTQNTCENIIPVAQISEDNEVSYNKTQSNEQLALDINYPKDSLPLIAIDSNNSEEEELVNESVENAEQFSSNINSPKEVLPMDLVRNKKMQHFESEITSEKCLSEYSSSSEDSDEEIYNMLSTQEEKQTKEDSQMSLEQFEVTEEKISKSFDNNLSTFEGITNMNDTSKILETSSSKVNAENEVLQEQEAPIKESNISEENGGNTDIFSTQPDPEEAVTATTTNIPVGICENLDILADVIENRIIADEFKTVESETVPKISENNKAGIQEDGDSSTSDSSTSDQNNSIHPIFIKESEVNFEAINAEPSKLIANSEKQSTAKSLIDEENLSGTKTDEFEKDGSGTLIENSEPLLESLIENSEMLVVNNNKPSEALNEMCDSVDSCAEDEKSKIITETENSKCLEKFSSEEDINETNNISRLISESNNIQSPDVIKENDEVIPETVTKKSENISQQTPNIESPVVIEENTEIITELEPKGSENISQLITEDLDILENSNNQIENSEIISEHTNVSNEEVINESHLSMQHVEPLEQLSVEKETELVKTISETTIENSDLKEESRNKNSGEKSEHTNKLPNTWEDTDIFKEINPEETESTDKSNKESTTVTVIETIEKDKSVSDIDIFKEIEPHETFDETESSDKYKTKESTTVTVTETTERSESVSDTDIFKEINPDETESSDKYKTKESTTVTVAETTERSESVSDTDIFKEINSDGIFDETESSDECKIMESTTVTVTETTERSESVSDTDIFKEISSDWTFAETESNDECKIKESATVTKAETIKEDESKSEALIKPTDSFERDECSELPKNKNIDIVETPSEAANYESNSEEEIEKSDRLLEKESLLECLSKSDTIKETPKSNRPIEDETSEYCKESDLAHKFLPKPEIVAENANKFSEIFESYREDCDSVSEAAVEKPYEAIENQRKGTESFEEESALVPEYLAISEAVIETPVSLVKDKIETTEIDAKESDADLKSEIEVLKLNSSVQDKNETIENSKDETEVTSKNIDDLASIDNQIHEELTVEHQVESLHDNINQELNKIHESCNMESDYNQQTLPKEDKLPTEKYQPDEALLTEHQTETLDRTSNDSLKETAVNKESSTQEDLSEDFLGFKNQSSFEDESEDFHGFEDLEEVTRIRQEIENLNDDSTANDGFLNYATLSRELHKSSTTSLTGSTSSEFNELEALEKELSQHQPETSTEMNELEALEKELSQHQPERGQEEEEEEDKETDRDIQTGTNKIVSTNDIEHIKQMLESDEEQLEHEENENNEDDKNHTEDRVQSTTMADKSKDKSKYILSSINSIIPKLSDLCRAALNSSLNSNSNLAQQHTTETPTILVERELSVEEALAEMYRQAGVLLSDPEDCDNDINPTGDEDEAHDVLLINLQEILNSDNNDVYVLQCDMNENVLNVVQQSAEESVDEQEQQLQLQHQVNNDNEVNRNTERVNTVQFIGILNTQSTEPQIHIISSDSESEVIILSDDESDIGFRPFIARPERITIPFINDNNNINDSDSLSDISTIHHEEIVPDNLNKFLQEEFYKYLHEKYVQRNISKYYHANRVLKKYKKRYIKLKRQ